MKIFLLSAFLSLTSLVVGCGNKFEECIQNQQEEYHELPLVTLSKSSPAAPALKVLPAIENETPAFKLRKEQQHRTQQQLQRTSLRPHQLQIHDDDDEAEEEEEECDVDVTGSQRGGVFQLSEHANKLQSTSPSLHDDLSRPSSSSRCAPLISTAIFILKVTLRRSSATSAASACGATELKNAACCSSGQQPLPWNWSLMACSMRFRLSEKR